MRTSSAGALAALVLSFCPLLAQDNVLILLADDLGVDMLESYGEGSDLPPTPNIDALAAEGVQFRNVWANPICSPTRATILTGRYSFRTQIGTIVTNSGAELSTSELTLPRMLDIHAEGYSHAAIGKWHLALPANAAQHPNDAGFGHFSGTPGNFGGGTQTYYSWVKVVNGTVGVGSQYATTDSVDDAVAWITSTPEPWFCYLAFNAPHDPYHAPPSELHTIELPNVDPRFEPRPFYKAAVEAVDTEIGRLLASLDPEVRARTTVIFLGDNGTPKDVTVPPFLPQHAKLTPYEGGLKVPLIISGPAVVEPGREVTALVNSTDLFSTVLELAGVTDLSQHPVTLDSTSVVPYLREPAQPPLRDVLYGEIFVPNGTGPFETLIRTVRGPRYKVIMRGMDHSQDELYDLLLDPWEERDLLKAFNLPNLPLEARAAYGHLRGQLDDLIASEP